MQLAFFHTEITPPPGHPLCAGLVEPVKEILDPQFAHGVLLKDDNQQPVVLLALDWCELRNSAHVHFRQALARSVGTTVERVAVQCVHQHDAPLPTAAAEKRLRVQASETRAMEQAFVEDAMRRCAHAAGLAAHALQPVTAVKVGQAPVHQVAGNRRVKRLADGTVGLMRGSACQEEDLRALPEGLIDPQLRTVAFFSGSRLLGALHYYATHPMAFYGKGQVSSDFCGLARQQLIAETNAPQIYFTGCGGNIAAGKYNDGSPPMRGILRDRMLQAMNASLQHLQPVEVRRLEWHSEPVLLPPREARKTWEATLQDEAQPYFQRLNAAWGLELWDAVERPQPIDISCLALGPVRVLHLPGEPFVEYQLWAQQQAPKNFVCVAGYGDGGTGYIPTAAAYPEGGYECSEVAQVAPASEDILHQAMLRVMA